MGIKTEEPIARADTGAGIRKKELVSIHQLHEFISKTDEQTQDADFLCNAKVLNVLQKNGWSYVSCTGCNRKLDKVGNALRCSKCVSSSVTGVVKYRVELAVHDGHDEATFVVFDNEMTKLTTKTAATLILENGNGGTRDDIPSCIEDLTGKQFLFQIKVTPFNFSSKHRTFTVSKLSEAYTNCTQTEITKGGPTFNLDLEGTTSSNIARFGQDTLDKEYEKVTTSIVETVEKSRKRGRE
ncbi:replication factor A protein 1 [Arabidopsis lyrata subsp. lyrata]|uniref:replication factor A protein 1 n=1 Tax=Arabidopsis lyrata subsp. lyrata TaxID=81972 RepID=UPI000A29A2A9|nr:replication factor A protein 1 [Arabidopsis lyrata subsp. lyrata]|eukprot:XP_020885057.1 replication factor A protein 1 [Arabidopsis lyrata subsp. lyrata]